MKCPICGFENPEGAKICRCGFFLEVANIPVEMEYQNKRIHSTEAEKAKCFQELINGILWTAVGILLIVGIFLIPGPTLDDKAKFASMALIIVVYGLYEAFRCHIKIRNLIVRAAMDKEKMR